MATKRRYAVAVVLCALAATVKNPAALGIAFVAAQAVRDAPAERRLGVAAKLGGIAVATLGLISVLTAIGFGWVGALGVPGKNLSYLTPTTFAAHFVSDLVGHDTGVLTAVRALGVVIAAIGITALIWRAPRLGTARACGLAPALVVACGPIVLPWYPLWAIVVLAAVGRRIERGFAIFASVLLAITVEPSGSVMPDIVLMSVVVIVALVVTAIVYQPTRRWIRRDLATAIDHYRSLGKLAGIPALLRQALPSRVDLRRAEAHPARSPA